MLSTYLIIKTCVCLLLLFLVVGIKDPVMSNPGYDYSEVGPSATICGSGTLSTKQEVSILISFPRHFFSLLP